MCVVSEISRRLVYVCVMCVYVIPNGISVTGNVVGGLWLLCQSSRLRGFAEGLATG